MKYRIEESDFDFVWSAQTKAVALDNGSKKNSVPYSTNKNFCIANKLPDGGKLPVKHIEGPSVLVDINGATPYDLLVTRIAPYLLLKKMLPDLNLVLISFLQNKISYPDYVLKIIEWLQEDEIIDSVIVANDFSQIAFDSVIVMHCLGSATVAGQARPELIGYKKINAEAFFDISGFYLGPALDHLREYISSHSKRDDAPMAGKVVVFPRSAIAFTKSVLEHARFLDSVEVSISQDGTEIIGNEQSMHNILFDSSKPGQLLSFIKNILIEEKAQKKLYISDENASLFHDFFIEYDYQMVYDDDPFDTILQYVINAKSLTIFAGDSLLWAGISPLDCLLTMIDPYPNDNELPYEDIVKSLMKLRTPVIIGRSGSKHQIDSQEILSIMSNTHNRLIDFNVVIPMAGKGSRFSSAGFNTPKPLIEAKGKTLVERSIDSLGLSGKFIFITRSFDDSGHNEELTKLFDRPASNNFVEVRVDDEHLGAAHSAAFSEKYLDKNMPLIITNCDQQMYWDSVKFQKFIVDNDPEGVLVVTKSSDPGNSYAIFNEETLVVSKVAEKRVISDYALVGIHYWKNPNDFYASFRESLATYKESGYPEAYVSITYNELITAGRKIMAYVIDTEEFVPLGTPEQLDIFLGRGRVAS